MDLILRRLQAVIFALVTDEDSPDSSKKMDLLGMQRLRMDWF